MKDDSNLRWTPQIKHICQEWHKTDYLLLPTGSFKVEGSIRHGEAVLNIHDITQPKQLKTETCISEEMSAMLHWRWWPCCTVWHASQMKSYHHAVQCWLICTVLVHRSMRTLPGGPDQHWASHHTWWYWRFQWSTHAQYYWRSKPSLCTYRWFWQYN